MTAEEKARERDLEASVASASGHLAARPSPPVRARRDLAERELAAFRAHLYSVHPELRLKRAEFEPAPLESLGTLLPDRRTALSEYVVGERASLLFVVKRGKTDIPTLKAYRVAANAKELQQLTAALRNGLAARGYDWKSAARRLHDLLIAPAAADLKGVSTLAIVPAGPLWQIPFSVLMDPSGRFPIEDSAVFYAHSLTALYESASNFKTAGGAPSMLAFANPDFDGKAAQLPEAALEARSIAKSYPAGRSRMYTGAQALESRLRAEAPRYSVIHLATHGVISDSNPM